MSKNFRKGVQANLTAKQAFAMDQEIRKQCIKVNEQYEKMLDIAIFNALNKVLHIGSKRAKDVYVEMLRQRDIMKRCFTELEEAERFMCETTLDIDFDTFYDECKAEAERGTE